MDKYSLTLTRDEAQLLVEMIKVTAAILRRNGDDALVAARLVRDTPYSIHESLSSSIVTLQDTL